MNFLEERIVKDGIVKEGNVLKVDSFLNHQMDIKLLNQMGAEFKKRFADKNINKILTIEASGIGIACIVAEHFDVPVVFAKKSQSINLDGEMYVAEVESFTHKCKNNVIVSQKFLSEDDHVLIIVIFLRTDVHCGTVQIVQSSGATVEGIGMQLRKDSSQAEESSVILDSSWSHWQLWTEWTLLRVRFSSESRMQRTKRPIFLKKL